MRLAAMSSAARLIDIEQGYARVVHRATGWPMGHVQLALQPKGMWAAFTETVYVGAQPTRRSAVELIVATHHMTKDNA